MKSHKQKQKQKEIVMVPQIEREKEESNVFTACPRCGDLTPISDKRLLVFYGNKDSEHGDAKWLCNNCYGMAEYLITKESTISINNNNNNNNDNTNNNNNVNNDMDNNNEMV